MQAFFITYQTEIRLSFFLSSLALMAALESFLRFRQHSISNERLKHLGLNFSLSIINTLILRFIFPTGLVGISIFSQSYDLGLLNYYSLGSLSEFLCGIILLDAFIYWQHRLMHKIPKLWKLHGVHHSDQFIDISTGLRFHTLEMIFSFTLKAGMIVIFGISPLVIIIFEVLLSSFSLFTHSNIVFPKRIETMLAKIFITPALHRVHHSIILHESNRNFGFSLNCWDKLFASFQEPELDQSATVFGREENQQVVQSNTLKDMLIEPFKK